MKALNLYVLSRYSDESSYTDYYKAMSGSEKAKQYASEEINSLRFFVDTLLTGGAKSRLFEDFFYGFEIPQIGKEFDILKIGKEFVLNIELKSRLNPEKARAQLIKNKFYLRHLSDRTQNFITFDADSGKIYMLTEETTLRLVKIGELINLMTRAEEAYKEDIEGLFSVSHFLVSPLNTPERFLNGEYFLTLQQQEIKDKILVNIDCGRGCYYAISGTAGTGKTLLLYDIAKALAERGKVGVIHCGQLSEGHRYISDTCENIDIFPVALLKNQFDTSPFRYVMIDEAQRIYKGQLEDLLKQLGKKATPVIFSFDPQQTLARSEANSDIPYFIAALGGVKFELTGKIRTNPELAAFIAGMGNMQKINCNYFYGAVDLLYANNTREAQNMIELYQERGYQFINHTPSQYASATLNSFDTSVVAHNVIGQEFDKVIVMIDNNFFYEDGKLKSKDHPYRNYLYHKMLFQEVTRVREKLAIVVLDNPDVFSYLLKIKNIRMARHD